MKLVRIMYKCRDIGYGIERGDGLGYITDEIDTWGKRTILIDESYQREAFKRIYLFEDEYRLGKVYD